MDYNFNYSNSTNYALNNSLIKQLIVRYGVQVKFLITEKINMTENVFGSFSHMKSDNEKIYDVFMMPEASDTWETSNDKYQGFGIMNFDNVNLYVFAADLDEVIDMNKIVSNILIFPNNKIMEITECSYVVPGVNNLFTYGDKKSVYKLSCVPHSFKLITELDNKDLLYNNTTEDVGGNDDADQATDEKEFETLNDYFEELTRQENQLKQHTEFDKTENAVIKKAVVDEKVKRAILNKEEKSPFGEFS